MGKTGSKIGLLQEQLGRNNNLEDSQLYQELPAVSMETMAVSILSHLTSSEIGHHLAHQLDNHLRHRIRIIERSSTLM